MADPVRRAGVEIAAPAALPHVDGLRVLALCEFVPFVSSGGTDHVVWQVYRRLAAMGAEVVLLTCAPPYRRMIDETREGVRIVGVPCIDLAPLLRAEATFSMTLFQRAFQHARRPRAAVIHANGLHFQSSLAAAAAGNMQRLPLVTTAHIGSLQHLSWGMRNAVALHERIVGKYILNRSDRIVAVSPSVARHLEDDLGIPGRRITVIANGVDHEVFRPRTSSARSVPRVIFVGRLIPNKGPALLMQALEQLARLGVAFNAKFVGDGPLRHALEHQARGAGLSDRVTFTGHVTDVASPLREADVLVRPSLTDGMPLAVLEAMASGVCVVASDAGGNSDLVRHRENGLLFPVGDLDAIVDQLVLALRDEALRSSLVRRGAATAAHHSWDACARATGQVLVEAASGDKWHFG